MIPTTYTYAVDRSGALEAALAEATGIKAEVVPVSSVTVRTADVLEPADKEALDKYMAGLGCSFTGSSPT